MGRGVFSREAESFPEAAKVVLLLFSLKIISVHLGLL